MRWCLLLLALTPSAAVAQVDTAERVYLCEPAHTFFCRNIHVACAGVTDIPTTPFTVSVAGAVATVAFAFAGPVPAQAGRVTGDGDLLVRLDDGRDWIRIDADGRYSHRIHDARGAAMSQGRCVPAPAG